jgi:hypothetical protein
MDTELDVIGELLVEYLEVVFLLGEELENALGDVLLDEFDNPVLLQHLSGYAER